VGSFEWRDPDADPENLRACGRRHRL
jgi:hypothetical protein